MDASNRRYSSGELGDDWSESAGDVSAEHEVGEAEFVASPLDLLGSGRGIAGEERQRVGGPDGLLAVRVTCVGWSMRGREFGGRC
jgi:hypothetical protein